MHKYMNYLARFGKSYNNSFEFDGRFKLWEKTDNFIKAWMDNHVSNQWIDTITDYITTKKKHTHTVAHNKFSDWSEDEMNPLLVLKPHTEKEEIKNKAKKHDTNATLSSSSESQERSNLTNTPDEVNWVKAGKVSPV